MTAFVQRQFIFFHALAWALLLTVSHIVAQDDEDSPNRPGLVATYAANNQTITRTDETIAFDWQAASPDPRLPAGNFTATWKGRLWARGAGQYHLLAYVNGDVKLKLAGKTLIESKSSTATSSEPKWLESQPLDLDFDHHPLEVIYTRTGKQGQLALFWSGPDFRLEPIPAWALVHDKVEDDKTDSPSTAFERGRQLATALRCAACHKDTAATFAAAPSLDRLSGNIHEGWLVDWLASSGDDNVKSSPRRMPHLNISRDEATAITAYLLREPPVKTEPKTEQKETKVTKEESKSTKAKKSKGEEKPKPSAEEGEKLLLTRGCLACHQLGNNGLSGLFGGGDLTSLATKRPADFLTRWLADPAAINGNHRMPVFSFTADEITSLNLWAKQQSAAHQPDAPAREKKNKLLEDGKKLVESLKCGSCHSLSRDKNPTPIADQKELTAASNWKNSCTNQPDRAKIKPGYQLTATDATALKEYYSTARPGLTHLSQQARGRDLLAQLNCLACHQREGALPPLPLGEGRGEGLEISATGLQAKLVALAETHPTLAPLIPAMTPPAVNSVGDKLHDQALSDSITRKGKPHRPYLLVQMPKFELSKDQLAALTAYFTSTDRIPKREGEAPAEPKARPAPAALAAAGPRLVTTDGLACTSCHQVGNVLPTKAPLNARGPDMSMLGSRIRREWFDRWCNNPARIVPRMEMPAVKIPVRGVLNDNVEDQLSAVWHILNTPGFQPPEPDPVRVLRLSGLSEKNERPLVIHDVVKDGDKTYLFPLVIGLPNRHNILFDLETNRLAAWWLGDTARQRTKGKSWYWEMGGKSILRGSDSLDFELTMVADGKKWVAQRGGQFAVNLSAYGESAFDYWQKMHRTDVEPASIDEDFFLLVRHQFMPTREAMAMGKFARGVTIDREGFCQFIRINVSRPDAIFQLKFASAIANEHRQWNPSTKTLRLGANEEIAIAISSDAGQKSKPVFKNDGSIQFETFSPPSTRGSWQSELAIVYSTSLPSDTFLVTPQPQIAVEGSAVQIAPGFNGTRLPLRGDIMPNGFAWDASGRLLFCTLKGQVFRETGFDANGLENEILCLADGLPTPYGIDVDEKNQPIVTTKVGLERLLEIERENRIAVQIVVSGWGHTDDYHDWAVGPIRGDGPRTYYLALPCQQDQRSEAAAEYRGKIVKVAARPANSSSPKSDIEIISAGHRFPMGMARNRDGELFVTDNQGNYNPFNELNHVKPGAHFGFINALEKEKGFTPPPLTEPAINIPHPWTRSVNGICFLETPVGWDQRAKQAQAHQSSAAGDGGPTPAKAGLSHPTNSIFGPLEGHLVGCEYDTRRLIRMSLDKVNGEYQGCCYPLSIPPADVEKGLLGPIVCAVKPTTGELYVGEIRDSGWGASNNIGQITKIKIEPEKLPCGIAEVKATKTGFTIDFFQPIDKTKAADLATYSIESYRRESTPAYGGSDIDRRPERITAVKLSDDAKRVTLTVEGLRPRHVYEFRLKNLSTDGKTFHPDEAHYTLKQIPQ